MYYSRTIYLYLIRKFALSIGGVLLGFLGLAFVIELVELLRRSSDASGLPTSLILEMAVLRLPTLLPKILPFAVLLGGVNTFASLTRSHELIVARAAGLSVWQFMLPAMTVAICSGIFVVSVVSPVGSATISRFQELEARNFKGMSSLLAVSTTGLWLRQVDTGGGQSVIHALRVSNQGTKLHDVSFFVNSAEDKLLRRIDAASAELHKGYWHLADVRITKPDQPEILSPSFDVPTTLTLREIQNSFAPPETLSIWALPAFIANLEAAGFSALRHRLHFHGSLALPFVLGAMVLLGACFSLRLTRHGGTGLVIGAGVFSGFLFYFISDIISALGQSGSLPAPVAAWIPGVIIAMTGTALLLHLEDG